MYNWESNHSQEQVTGPWSFTRGGSVRIEKNRASYDRPKTLMTFIVKVRVFAARRNLAWRKFEHFSGLREQID